MLLAKYIELLQKHFKKSISNEELWNLLAGSVIDPLNLKNKNGEVLYYDKRVVSELMAGKKNIPVKIRDNIYEQAVLDTIVAYFETNIVSELMPDIDDLCFQLIKLIEADEELSPQRKASFRLLAHKNTIAAFLAECFVLVVTKGNKTKPHETDLTSDERDIVSPLPPTLQVKGILIDGFLSDTFVIKRFLDRCGISEDYYISRLKALYKQVDDIKVDARNITHYGVEAVLMKDSKVKIDASTKKTLTSVAQTFDIKMSNDFFELGDLTKDLFRLPTIYGSDEGLKGSDEEINKYHLLQEIELVISDFAKALPFMNAFKDIYVIELILSNDGSSFDEDVRINLHIPSESFLSLDEIMDMERSALDYIIDGCDTVKCFGISRGRDYLDYQSSVRESIHHAQPYYSPYGNDWTREDYKEELQGIFDYFVSKDNNYYVIETKIDEIMQHTAVAFPNVILLKKNATEIPYTIRSKYSPNVIEGIIISRDKQDE